MKPICQKVQTESQYQSALSIRKKVFIEEQKISTQLEIDSYEKNSTHFLLGIDGENVACGRYRLLEGQIKFERIATLKAYRGRGFAKTLISFMLQDCFNKHPKLEIYLHAQESSFPFYDKIGWTREGSEFYEADILHCRYTYKGDPKSLSFIEND